MPSFFVSIRLAIGALAALAAEGADAGSILGKDHTASLCERAANKASSESQVPRNILLAIARVETGRTIKGAYGPWPWTVNVEGVGRYFTSKANAANFIRARLQEGYSSIDAGCFQISFRWHADKFDSIEQILDPLENARYAAAFLQSLYAEFGDWETAAGAYHSRNAEFSEPYLKKFRNVLADIQSVPAKEKDRPRNAFPLLNGRSNSASRGSLFPQTHRSPGFFTTAQKRG